MPGRQGIGLGSCWEGTKENRKGSTADRKRERRQPGMVILQKLFGRFVINLQSDTTSQFERSFR